FNVTSFVDDGIIVYLNGVELFNFNVPATRPMTWDVNTLPGGANPAPFGEPSIFPTNIIPANLLVGDNVIAVELHQQGGGSSDDVFAMRLNAALPLSATIIDPTQPTNRVVLANRPTTLIVKATGAPAPTYQWFKNGVAIDPAVN